MKRASVVDLVVLALGAAALVYAATRPTRRICAAPAQLTIVLQPWASHAALDAAGWTRMGRDVHQLGYTQVLLQWSRYGDYEFWPEGRSRWLSAGLRHLTAAGLTLIMGLHMGQDYYQVLQESDDAVARHLADARAKAPAQAREILNEPLGAKLVGWYLPQEIDDLHWRSPRRQRLLADYFAGVSHQLAALAPGLPYYASAFFSGATPPETFARQLADLHHETGVIWIVQDGLGTGRLSEARTRAYLRAIARALPPAAWRGLQEAFDERRTNGRSMFTPAGPETIERRAAVWCEATGRRAEMVFSMNQLMTETLPAP